MFICIHLRAHHHPHRTHCLQPRDRDHDYDHDRVNVRENGLQNDRAHVTPVPF